MQITLVPEAKLGIAIFNNLHETKANIALTNALLDRILGLKPKDWNAYYQGLDNAEAEAKAKAKAARDRDRKPNSKPLATLESHTGTYGHPAYGTGKVKLDDGKLVWEWSSFRVPLEHWDGETFRATAGYFEDELFEFTAPKGEVLGLSQRGVPFEKK